MDKMPYFSWKRLYQSEFFSVIMLIVVVTALFFPVMAGWRGIFHDDLVRESFPRYYFIANNLQRGILPLWDPQTWCGAIPFYAQYLSDTYYICLWPAFFLANLNNLMHSYWLLILLPLWLHYILGAGGMFFFLRRLIGCGRFSSYFGALAYVLSPCFIYAHVWPQAVFALAWLPWLLLIYTSAVKEWRTWKIIAGGLVFPFILTSGQITYWHFTALLWAVVIVLTIVFQLHARKGSALKVPLLAAFLICIIGIGLSSVYLFSFIDGRQYTQEHLELTLNAALSREGGSLPPFYLATLLVPDLFFNITGVKLLDIIPDEIYFWEANMSGGMAVSLLVMLALVLALVVPLINSQDRQKRWWAVAFGGVYLFAVLCTLGRYTPFYRYVIGSLPIIKILHLPVRYRMLQCFAAAVLAPIALDYLGASSLILRLKIHLRRWVWVYIVCSFFIIMAALNYSFNYCSYKIFNNWSEDPISTAKSHFSIGKGVGRYTSPHFITRKIGVIFDDESFGEIRYADNDKVLPTEGTLAVYYYASGKGWYEFDVNIPPHKFVWIYQKSGGAKIGYKKSEISNNIYRYDNNEKEWIISSQMNALWFYYGDIVRGGSKVNSALRESRGRRSLKEEFLRLFREEEFFRKWFIISVLYWVLFSVVIIFGLHFLSSKRFRYFLGVVALLEFFFFAVSAFYFSGYGWYTGEDIPQRYTDPLNVPTVREIIGPLKAVANKSTLRIASLLPYFDNYVRLNGRFALMGFGMHPIETRFKRALEAAYGRPLDWDYYNKPHNPVHLPFLNNFSVGYFLSTDSRNFLLGGTTVMLHGSPKLFVHVNSNALPRVCTLDRVIEASEEEQLNQLVSGDLRRAVYISPFGYSQLQKFTADSAEDIGFYFTELQQANRILRLNLDNPNRIEVDIKINKPAMLVLTEVWYPGWEATIDGRSAPIFRVNYCQRGIWLEKGKHKVRFRFRPRAWRWGMGISLGTLVLLVGWLALYKIRKRLEK
jgi:hypothetical protein